MKRFIVLLLCLCLSASCFGDVTITGSGCISVAQWINNGCYALIPGQGYMVILSDGRVLYSSKRQVMFVDENRCVVDGAWVYRRVTPPALPAPPARIAAPAEFHAPIAPLGEMRPVSQDRRTRKLTIHFADGSTVTKLVEPPAESKPVEGIPNGDESPEPADVPNYEPPQFGNGVRNMLPRRSNQNPN